MSGDTGRKPAVLSRNDRGSLESAMISQNSNALAWSQGIAVCGRCCYLKAVPQELVIDGVVVLHFRHLDESSQQARAAVG